MRFYKNFIREDMVTAYTTYFNWREEGVEKKEITLEKGEECEENNDEEKDEEWV